MPSWTVAEMRVTSGGRRTGWYSQSPSTTGAPTSAPPSRVPASFTSRPPPGHLTEAGTTVRRRRWPAHASRNWIGSLPGREVRLVGLVVRGGGGADVVEGAADGRGQHELLGGQRAQQLRPVPGADHRGDDPGAVAHPGQRDGQWRGAQAVGGGDHGLDDARGPLGAVAPDVAREVRRRAAGIGGRPLSVL